MRRRARRGPRSGAAWGPRNSSSRPRTSRNAKTTLKPGSGRSSRPWRAGSCREPAGWPWLRCWPWVRPESSPRPISRPTSGDRPELTYGADKALSARLDAAVRDLARLNDDVVTLGDEARGAPGEPLGGERGRAPDGTTARAIGPSWRSRPARPASTPGSVARPGRALAWRTWPGHTDRTLIDRWHQVCLAIESVAPLADDWAAMETAPGWRCTVVDDINNHDSIGLQCAPAGDAGPLSGGAGDSFTPPRPRSPTLSGSPPAWPRSADVSTLTPVAEPNRGHGRRARPAVADDDRLQRPDHAPGHRRAQGRRPTPRRSCPTTTASSRSCSTRLAGNLTGHGISIETAKGQLASALADLAGVSVLPQ